MEFCFRIIISSLLLIGMTTTQAVAQVAINNSGITPDSSAMLDISSSEKGILIPRMSTTERLAIANGAPSTGLLVFDHTTDSFWYYSGTSWQELQGGQANKLADADNDTQIQVEESPDEDAIRFDIAGSQMVKMSQELSYISWDEYTVDDDYPSADYVHAADVDGDGDMDVLAVSAGQDDISLWDNDGNQVFSRYDLTFFRYNGAADIRTADVDGDGDLDIISAASNDHDISWWENLGPLDFIKHTVVDTFERAQRVEGFDLDQDGDMDLIAGSDGSHEIAWWENDGNQNFTQYIIVSNYDNAIDIDIADIDEDGDWDILGVSDDLNEIAWFINDGNQNFSKVNINSSLSSPIRAIAIDLDADADIDVVGLDRDDDEVVWWENDGNMNFTEHIVDNTLTSPNDLDIVDIDNDADLDLLVTDFSGDQILLYQNDGQQNFTAEIISDVEDKPRGIRGADIDSDGDLDILTSSSINNTGHILWWNNDGPELPVVQITATEVTPSGSAILDVNSTEQGVLIPRMSTTERNAIGDPATSLLVFDTDSIGFWFYNGTNWTALAGDNDTSNELQDISLSGSVLSISEGSSVDLSTLAGDDPAFTSLAGLTAAVYPTDDFLFGASTLDNAGGPEQKFFFDQAKGAFRAGGITNTNWDQDSLGNYSFAAGYNSSATSLYATAIGSSATASSNNAIALGRNALASSTDAVALGLDARATGNYSYAIGRSSQAIANNSVAIGRVASAGGNVSTALGYGVNTFSFGEVAVGIFNTAYTANNSGGFDINDRQFVVGNGSSDANRSDAFIIYKSGDAELYGKLGIGTNATNGTLEIGSALSSSALNNVDYSYLNCCNSAEGVLVTDNTTNKDISIYATGRIVGQFVISTSDERIKDIKGLSNPEEDLETLMQIEITDYEYRDKIKEGNTRQKKVIAQQVAEVYPQAVNKQFTEVVPDIYQRAQVEEGWIQLATDLKVGERVKLITKTSSEVHEVSAVEADRFQVSALFTDHPALTTDILSTDHQAMTTVFVYGRQVDDFHTVDYDAIAMLNVSATKALVQRVEKLEEENEELQRQLAKVEQLEAMLMQMQSSRQERQLPQTVSTHNK